MKTFVYKDHEIYARIWDSFTDTYTVDENGKPLKSTRKKVGNNEMQVFYYEFEAVNPETGELETYGEEEFTDIEDVKAYIDKSVRYVNKNHLLSKALA